MAKRIRKQDKVFFHFEDELLHGHVTDDDGDEIEIYVDEPYREGDEDLDYYVIPRDEVITQAEMLRKMQAASGGASATATADKLILDLGAFREAVKKARHKDDPRLGIPIVVLVPSDAPRRRKLVFKDGRTKHELTWSTTNFSRPLTNTYLAASQSIQEALGNYFDEPPVMDFFFATYETRRHNYSHATFVAFVPAKKNSKKFKDLAKAAKEATEKSRRAIFSGGPGSSIYVAA